MKVLNFPPDVSGSPHDPARRQTLLRLGALAVASGVASGCALAPDYDHNDPESPQVTWEVKPASWALVLGSGGPRGFVHVGVLKALDELGVKPPMVVGASVGAVVGAMWACGFTGKELESMAMEVNALKFMKIAIGARERLNGSGIANWINAQLSSRLRGALLEDMPIRFVPTAVRVSDRVLVGFGKGDVGVAVQASSAIEGQFTPVRIRGVRYVDPDLVAPMPVRFARALGAQRVLSVDPSAHEEKAPASATHFREGDLRKRALTQPDALAADLNLHPEFAYYVSLSEEFRRNTIRAGYEQTLARAADIHALARG